MKKPNGDNYAADSVLYLTYGIQEYLFENGRIDNIFTDQYYEPFTSALHEVVKDFKVIDWCTILYYSMKLFLNLNINDPKCKSTLILASTERAGILCY